VEAPEGTAARCNPVSIRLSVYRVNGTSTGDKVDFYRRIAAGVIDGSSNDFLDRHNSTIESIDGQMG
jgi:hypothetical protein